MAVGYTAITTPGTKYTYRISAINLTGQVTIASTALTVVADLTAPVAPLAPTVLSAIALTSTTAQLSWIDNATTETAYSVEVSTNAGPYVALAPLAANSIGYTATVAVGNTYRYQVRALTTNLGSTTYSTYVGPVGVNMVMPVAPTLPSATPAVSGATVALSWTDNATNETGYLVEVSTNGGTSYTTVATVARTAAESAANAVVASYTASSTPGFINTYRISALNGPLASTAITVAVDLTPPAAPLAPTVLTANVVSSTSLQLNWIDNATTETGYSVEVSTNGGAYVALAPLAANSTGYLATVAVGNTYNFQVRALTTTLGSTTYSTYVGPVGINMAVPAAPTAPSAVPAANGASVALSWTDNATNETGYLVEVSTNGTTYTTLTTIARTALGSAATAVAVNYTATSTPGAINTYRVTALNVIGAVTISSTAITVDANLTAPLAPLAPTSLATSITGNTSVQLTWIDNASTETGYSVEVSTNGGAYVSLAPLPANTIAYTATVAAGNTYSYQVRALTTNLGSTTYSTYVGPVGVDMTIPVAPTALIATPTVSGTSVALSWTDNATNETGYLVEVSTNNGVSYTSLASIARTAAEITSVGGVVGYNATAIPGTRYTYRVTATKATGAALIASAAITVTADLNATASAAPTAVASALLTATTVRVEWMDNANDETGYRIDSSIDGGLTYSVAFDWGRTPAQSVSTGILLGYNLTVVPGYKYLFRVSTYKTQYGLTTYSIGVLSNSVDATFPAAPTGLPVVINNAGTQATLSWTDNAINETAYQVDVSTDNGLTYLPLATIARNATESAATAGVLSYNAVTVMGIKYNYRITATNVAGSSIPLTLIADLSTPVAPSALTATPDAAGTTVALSWTDNASNESSYLVEVSTNNGLTYSNLTTIARTAAESAATAGVINYNAASVPGNKYIYRVSAQVVKASTLTSTAITAAVNINPTIPAVPTAVAAGLSSATLARVEWLDNANDESGYLIEASIDGGLTYTVMVNWGRTAAQSASTGILLGYNLTIVPGNIYIFRVSSYKTQYGLTANSAGVNSNSVDVKLPAAPTVLPVVIGSTGTQVTLSWTDNANNETGYLVEVSTNGGLSYTNLATVGRSAAQSTATAGTVNYTAVTAPGTLYTYRVTAFNLVGSSAPITLLADLVTPPVPPVAPTLVSAALSAATTARIDWMDNATDETGYRIEASTNGGLTYTVVFDWGRTAAQSLSTGMLGYIANVVPGNTYIFRISSYKTQYGLTSYSTSMASGSVVVP